MAGGATSGRETEVKLRVDGASAFEALARFAGTTPLPTKTQTNHFFDTADLRLNTAKHTLRLRHESDTYTLSAKGPERKSASGTLTEKSEEEVVVSSEEAASLLTASTSPLTLLESRAQRTAVPLLRMIRALVANQPLTHVGSFENKRTPLTVRLTVSGALVDVLFELDRTSFPGGYVHYEVEVELKGIDEKAGEEAVHAFCQAAQVPWREGPPKAKRFFNLVAGRSIE